MTGDSPDVRPNNETKKPTVEKVILQAHYQTVHIYKLYLCPYFQLSLKNHNVSSARKLVYFLTFKNVLLDILVLKTNSYRTYRVKIT